MSALQNDTIDETDLISIRGNKLMSIADMHFNAKAYIEFPILALYIIYFVPTIFLYIKNCEHPVIKYRQPKNVISASILCSLNSIITPIFRYIKVPCLLNTWFINPLIFSFVIITFSRYIRTYYMQKLSIFKLRFTEKKKGKGKGNDFNKSSGSVRLKESFAKDMTNETESSHKSSLHTKNSSISNDLSENSFVIGDPIIYFKKLNSIINKKITIILVIIPCLLLLIHSIVITILYWNGEESMKKPCVNDHDQVGAPKMLLNIAILTSAVFLLYQAYYKQKWDKDIKTEYTIFVILDAFCTLFMQAIIRNAFGMTVLQYRGYTFHLFNIVIHGICVIEPLCKIFIYNHTEKEGKLTQEEFLNRLSNATFKAQVKDIANHTFCIENILFYEAYCNLMNMVIVFYNRKTTSGIYESGNFTCSDILHKNVINPVLYKPFELNFKPQFEQVYNLYIKEDGIAAINIKSSTIRNIEEQMANENYTYLMFNQAAEEISDLLYNNIYPKMKL